MPPASTRPELGVDKAPEGAAGFDTRAGSYGAKRTSGRLQRRLDKIAFTRPGRAVYRRLIGTDALILTTIGRKSGVERPVPVAGFPGADGRSWLIVAAAGGTAANPAWYSNMAARPGEVEIQIDGRRTPVTARQLHGAERAAAWRQITDTSPQFARFQQKTDRKLPVIRLTPRPANRSGPGAAGL